jgi:hypothetical protein
MSDGFISHCCHPDPTEYERNATAKIVVEPNGRIHHYAWINDGWHNTHISNPGDRERILARTENYWALVQRGLGKSWKERESYMADGVRKIDRKLGAGGGHEA